MKLLSIILVCAMVAPTCIAKTEEKASVRLPLTAVEADSMQWLDFFWYYYKDKGARFLGLPAQGASLSGNGALTTENATSMNAARGKERATIKHKNEWPWAVKGKASPKREVEAAKISLTGCEGDINKALHLFRENYSLAMLTGQARYFDYAERILYNDILRYWTMVENGLLTDEDTSEKAKRQVADLLRTAGKMTYALSGEHIYVNMLGRGLVHLKNRQLEAYIQSMSSSPWYYQTSLSFQADGSLIPMEDSQQIDDYTRVFFHDTTTINGGHCAPDSVKATIHVRIPLWVSGKDMLAGYQTTATRGRVQIFVNGKLAIPEIQDGYAVLSGVWHVRDLIAIKIPTPILRVWKQTDAARSQVALQRGPIVYCLEEQGGGDVFFNPKSAVSHRFSKQDSCMTLIVPVEKDGKADTLRALPYYKCGAPKKRSASSHYQNQKSGAIFMNAK